MKPDARAAVRPSEPNAGVEASWHGKVLGFLTLLFFLRVVGQFLVAFFSVNWLPAMERWYSGLLPYPPLLNIQLVMLLVMTRISVNISRGAGCFARKRPAWSRFLTSFSATMPAPWCCATP